MEEVELAVALARRDFGPVVARVVRVAVQYPGLKHGEIVARCTSGDQPISLQAVDSSISVLLMHGILYAEARPASSLGKPKESRSLNPRRAVPAAPGAPGADADAHGTGTSGQAANGNGAKSVGVAGDSGVPANSVLSYKVRTDMLVKRTRIPKQLWLLERLAGPHAKTIGLLLFRHGRMTAKTICDQIALDGGDDEALRGIEDAMIVLVKGGSMRRVGSVKGGVVGSKIVDIVGDEHEGQAGVANPGYASDDSEKAAEVFAAQERHERSLAMLTADEKNQTVPVFNKETGQVITGRGINSKFVNAPVRTNGDDLWAISSWFLDRVLRNHTCQKVIEVLLDEAPGSPGPTVYRSGLNVAIEMDDPDECSDEAETKAVTFDDLREELDRGGARELDQSQFQSALQRLIDLKPAMARVPVAHNQTSIVFCPAQAIFLSRQGTVDATLRHMFGLHGLRVWRALANEGCMQEKMISDKLLMSLKDVRIILFELLSEGYISTQEVPKSNEPARQDRLSGVWYLWRADVTATHMRVLNKALHATLRHLLKAENLRNSPLPTEPDAAAKRTTKLQLLEASIARLDNLVILFRDFGPLDSSYYKHFYNTGEQEYF